MQTPTFTCATCDATVIDRPVFHLGLAFCCAGCAADGPCMCSYDPVVASPDAPGAATADVELPLRESLHRGFARTELVAAPEDIEERTLVAVEA